MDISGSTSPLTGCSGTYEDTAGQVVRGKRSQALTQANLTDSHSAYTSVFVMEIKV